MGKKLNIENVLNIFQREKYRQLKDDLQRKPEFVKIQAAFEQAKRKYDAERVLYEQSKQKQSEISNAINQLETALTQEHKRVADLDKKIQ